MNNLFACLNQFNSALHMLQECTCAARIQSLSCHVEILYILHFSILWMCMRDVNEQVYGTGLPAAAIKFKLRAGSPEQTDDWTIPNT